MPAGVNDPHLLLYSIASWTTVWFDWTILSYFVQCALDGVKGHTICYFVIKVFRNIFVNGFEIVASPFDTSFKIRSKFGLLRQERVGRMIMSFDTTNLSSTTRARPKQANFSNSTHRSIIFGCFDTTVYSNPPEEYRVDPFLLPSKIL